MAIVFVTVAPIGLRPADPLSVGLDRALAFAAMAALFVCAYPRHAWIAAFFVIASAGGIELLQLLSPTRHAHLDDALVKAVGAFCGVLLGGAINLVRGVRCRAADS
ncbi:VanZ family protein [Consotaella salsifontis]|uniref:VanZ family protein n=1 Tax=Consotaella salsifontis TaxID=1365950 RepID=UPI001FD99237|nr:VanZ family protein [Consotaella salsifontis]